MSDDEDNQVAPQVLPHRQNEEVEGEDEEGDDEASIHSEEGDESQDSQIQLPNVANDARLHEAKMRALAVRKPRPMEEKEDIKIYLENFENFASVMGVPIDFRYQSFVSYLPDKLKLKLRSLGLSNKKMKKWSTMKRIILKTLTPPAEKLDARLKLDKAKQETGESIDDYVERLRLLVEKCYSKKDEKPIRERVMKDLFTSGLTDNQVGIEVLTYSDTMSLDELVQMAIRRELAIQAREKVSAVKDGTLSILNVQQPLSGPSQSMYHQRTMPHLESLQQPVCHQYMFPQDYDNDPAYNSRRCFCCNSIFHFVANCPQRNRRTRRPIRCFECQGAHYRRDCPYLDGVHFYPSEDLNGSNEHREEYPEPSGINNLSIRGIHQQSRHSTSHQRGLVDIESPRLTPGNGDGTVMSVKDYYLPQDSDEDPIMDGETGEVLSLFLDLD